MVRAQRTGWGLCCSGPSWCLGLVPLLRRKSRCPALQQLWTVHANLIGRQTHSSCIAPHLTPRNRALDQSERDRQFFFIRVILEGGFLSAPPPPFPTRLLDCWKLPLPIPSSDHPSGSPIRPHTHAALAAPRTEVIPSRRPLSARIDHPFTIFELCLGASNLHGD